MVPPRSKTARPAASTRERLIEVTASHLGECGPRGVELRAVCEEIGVSPSLVNYYFDSPSELLYHAALYGYREHVLAQRAGLEAATDGTSAVETWVLTTLAWKRANTGLVAVIDYPMLALGGRDDTTPDDFIKSLSSLSRENVTTLGSGVYSLLTGKPPRRISTARVAALIRLNHDFAFWISVVGFASNGAGTWIAGRKPYGRLWTAFGFEPDRQIIATLDALVSRLGQEPADGIPDPDTLRVSAEDDERELTP